MTHLFKYSCTKPHICTTIIVQKHTTTCMYPYNSLYKSVQYCPSSINEDNYTSVTYKYCPGSNIGYVTVQKESYAKYAE